jgi:hypothetical protein
MSSKGLRLSETWFRRGLWLVALVFAGFLTGLGGTLVGDLPQVVPAHTLDDFVDPAAAAPHRAAQRAAEQAGRAAQDALERAELLRKAAQRDTAAARKTFDDWLATRSVTQRTDQDPELIARTRELDTLQARERAADAAVEAQEQIALDARQAAAQAEGRLQSLQSDAQARLDRELRRAELRVFLYRLALTLPLLAIAGWLFVRKRKSPSWPFVWGFVFFALFTFFVELVPYLPSYGGYVRYLVGIVVTVAAGRQAIVALQRYLDRQKLAEALPEQVRREELGYDTALARLAKGVCPGCERGVDLKDPAIDFCPHCGIGLHDRCGGCGTRKSAFSRFCFACGAPGGTAASPDAGGEPPAPAAAA